jgi:hypothetical protein
VLSGRLGDIGKIEIENNLTPVNCPRDYEIGIHDSLIPINHEIRIDPKIESPGSLANCARRRSASLSNYRARLQTDPLTDLDLIIAIIKNAVEPFVEIRYVIAAIEVIIDENLPVTGKRIAAALQPLEIFQRRQSLKEIGAGKAFGSRAAALDLGEDPVFPDAGFNGSKTTGSAIEVADAGEIRRP